MEENREPEINPYLCQLTYKKGGRNIKWRIDSLLNNGVGKSGQLRSKESTVLLFHTIYKNKFKMD